MIKFIIISLLSITSYAQSLKKDLYIFLETKPQFESKNDTTIIEKYILTYKTPCDGIKYDLSITTEGNLKIEKLISGSPGPSVGFTYINENSKNDPIIIYKNNMTNKLIFNEVRCSVSYKQFVEISKKFNIFIVNEKDYSNNEYYLAKKVSFEAIGGL